MGTEIKGSEIIEDGWANKAKEGGKDLLEILNALDKELISIADSVDHLKSLGIGASAKDMANLNAALDKTNKARKLAVELERDEVKELKNLEKQRLEEIRLQQAREKSFDSYEKKLQKEAKALEKQRLEEIKLQKAREKSIDDYNKKAEKQSKILANQLLPWNQLNTKIKELTERYRNLLIAEGKETAETKKLKAEILALNRVRDTANENLGMHQNKVGQYERALGSLKNMLGQLGVAFGVFEILKSSFTILADYDEKLADIAKTTGLTIEASNEISLALLDIDTRTSITNLQELASAAGRLGIEGKDNIIGFARAADKVFVALGDDLEGTAEEIATGLGKISALAGFEKEFGIEGGIERVGSMLNELASSSKASAGAIFEFLNRTAGISSVAGIAVEDMAALGALFDSTGQSVEVAATTLNTLLPALSSDQERFAKVAGMTAEAFSQMLKDAPIEALKAVAIGAKSSKGGLDGLVESLGEFGVDSARAASIVGVLATSTDELTKLQKTSTEAVKENTSVTDEFNKKNNTLNGAVEKLKKHGKV
jgi:TP901 family phage tail tape measure protein